MAEKTDKTEKTTKKTAATKKTTAARKTAAAKKTVAAAPARPAAAARPALRKSVARKRAAATVSSAAAVAQTVTGWRRFHRRTKIGVVVSAKQPRTVIVAIERLREHPLYKKVVRVRKRFAAHDEAGDVREGDLVRIQEGRPYSATKRWRVVEVLSRLGEAGAAAPRVAEIEKALEEAEGVTELLAKPEAEAAEEATAEEEAER